MFGKYKSSNNGRNNAGRHGGLHSSSNNRNHNNNNNINNGSFNTNKHNVPKGSSPKSLAPQSFPSAFAPSSSSSPLSLPEVTAPVPPAAAGALHQPPIGALLRHLPTQELTDLEIALRAILYVLCDNMCPVVKSLNEKRRTCVRDVQAMLRANEAVGELYGSGRTGLTACTSSDLDFVAVVDGTPCAPPPADSTRNKGMSGFYRRSPSEGGGEGKEERKGEAKKKGKGSAAKRGREDNDEARFFDESDFDTDGDLSDDGHNGKFGGRSGGAATAAIDSNATNLFNMTRSQRRREMGPLVRSLIGHAASFRRGGGGADSGPLSTPQQQAQGGGASSFLSRHQQQTARRHSERYGAAGPPIFVGFKPIINAKVPLLKCTHRPTQIEVDLSFALDGARSSDYLIHRLNSQSPQCLVAARGLIVLLKHLLHEHDLNDPSVGGLGSFPLCLMVVWFLESEVHKNFPIDLQGSYAVLLTRFFAYYGETFDPTQCGIDLVGKEMFSKASSSVLVVKNPLDRSLNAASACSRYVSDVRPLFQRLHKQLMQAMAPRKGSGSVFETSSSPSSSSAAQAAERLFRKAIQPDAHRRCYEAFAAALKGYKDAASSHKPPTLTPTFLKSVLAPVSTTWGDEMVCEMEGIGLGMQW